MAQEAFVRAFRGLGTWRRDAAFSTWLLRWPRTCTDRRSAGSRRGLSRSKISPSSSGALLSVIVDVGTHPATAWLALAVLLTVAPVMWSLRLMRA